jgi:folate-binding protein YgfZ
VSEDNFPKEARLDSHISYEKGCYLGQETIARMHYRGHPNWLLVGLTTGEKAPAPFTYDENADASALTLDHVAGTELFSLDSPQTAEAIADQISEGGPVGGGAAPKAAGRITSGAMSPRLKRALFLGYVRASMAEVGTKFRARIAGVDLTLSVVALPLPGPIKGEKHA